MSALSSLWPWLVLGAVLLAVTWAYGRARAGGAGAERDAAHAKEDRDAQERVEAQRARPRTRRDVLRWLRRADENEPDPSP